MDFSLFIYIILGIIPSTAWLFYYLAKDLHPEPKKQILRIFLWGAFITIPVFFVQIGLAKLLELLELSQNVKSILQWFLVIAFTEELFKFLVVRIKIMGTPDLDEPVDFMVYMVVAALGFAAVENVLYLLTPTGQMSIDAIINRTLIIFFIRFLGSTFLHTLCSSIIGYSMAIANLKTNVRRIFVALGIIVATIFHGFYNLSFTALADYSQLTIPASILIIMAIMVFNGFGQLKKMKGLSQVTIK